MQRTLLPASSAGLLAAALLAGPIAAPSAALASPLQLQVGVSADVGVPDGGTAALAVAPLAMLRLHAGLSHNTVSPGVRLGATLVPLATWATPTLSLDWGRFAEGDANPMVRRLSGDASFSSPTLERFAYDYVNAHLGLELGRSWGTFYLHAGASRVTAVAHDLDDELEDMSGAQSSDTTVTFTQDPKVTAWGPSARIGFILYLRN
jgi:hypothetical protein